MDFFERCTYLSMNPVLLGRDSQYRVELFFKGIVINGPKGKVKCHATRVEFQVRGSPHIHSFSRTVNVPISFKDNVVEYTQFIDGFVTALYLIYMKIQNFLI